MASQQLSDIRDRLKKDPFPRSLGAPSFDPSTVTKELLRDLRKLLRSASSTSCLDPINEQRVRDIVTHASALAEGRTLARGVRSLVHAMIGFPGELNPEIRLGALDAGITWLRTRSVQTRQTLAAFIAHDGEGALNVMTARRIAELLSSDSAITRGGAYEILGTAAANLNQSCELRRFILDSLARRLTVIAKDFAEYRREDGACSALIALLVHRDADMRQQAAQDLVRGPLNVGSRSQAYIRSFLALHPDTSDLAAAWIDKLTLYHYPRSTHSPSTDADLAALCKLEDVAHSLEHALETGPRRPIELKHLLKALTEEWGLSGTAEGKRIRSACEELLRRNVGTITPSDIDNPSFFRTLNGVSDAAPVYSALLHRAVQVGEHADLTAIVRLVSYFSSQTNSFSSFFSTRLALFTAEKMTDPLQMARAVKEAPTELLSCISCAELPLALRTNLARRVLSHLGEVPVESREAHMLQEGAEHRMQRGAKEEPYRQYLLDAFRDELKAVRKGRPSARLFRAMVNQPESSLYEPSPAYAVVIREVVQSYLAGVGLPGARFFRGSKGFWPAGTYQGQRVERAVCHHIDAIAYLEANEPGSAALLHRLCGIAFFGRYPRSVLLNQAVHLKRITEERVRPRRDARCAVVLYPRSDWNGAFWNDSVRTAFARDFVRERPDVPLLICEAGTPRGALRQLVRQSRAFGKISLLHLHTHGSPIGEMVFGEDSDLLPKDVVATKTRRWLQRVLAPEVSVLVSSCFAGASGNLIDEVAQAHWNLHMRLIGQVADGALEEMKLPSELQNFLDIDAEFSTSTRVAIAGKSRRYR